MWMGTSSPTWGPSMVRSNGEEAPTAAGPLPQAPSRPLGNLTLGTWGRCPGARPVCAHAPSAASSEVRFTGDQGLQTGFQDRGTR